MSATVTTPEAALLVGVSERTIEQWVARGYLTPCNRSGPRRMTWRARYLTEDVWECAAARKPKTWHARLDRLAVDAGLVATAGEL
jgi:phage terminase Nu1 subunit (DNA packaging protein)